MKFIIGLAISNLLGIITGVLLVVGKKGGAE
jgi:hypothetical protein